MTNSRTTENLQFLPLLREADRLLAETPPARALKQRVLAQVETKTKKKAAPKSGSLLEAMFVVLAAVGFTILCIDDSPMPNHVAIEHPQKTEERSLTVPEPVPNEMVSPSPEPIHPSKRSADDSPPQRSRPMTTPKSAFDGPLSPLPRDSSETGPAPRIRFPRKTNPKSWPSATSRPPLVPKRETPFLDPLTSPTFGSAPQSEKPTMTLPGSGSGSRPRSTETEIRYESKRNDSQQGPGAPAMPNNPDEQDKDVGIHVIGIYEADAGSASVHFARSGPAVLVLSAYAATNWTVTTGPDADIRSIYLFGYEKQKLAMAPEAIVVISTYEQTQEFLGCAYEWPDNDPQSGCETGEFLAAIKETLGLSVASFHGCYAGAAFTLSDDGANGACLDGYPFSGFPW
jgi:hypothetical protein